MIVPIPYVHVGVGALCALLSLPLIFRMVPMNRGYGIRLPKAYVSEANWYALNAFGGKMILGFGLFLIVFAFATLDLAPPPTSILAPVFLAVPLALLIPVVLLVKAYARRLPDRP